MRVLVADDHEMIREAVKAILAGESGIEIVGEARDGPSALRLARELVPDAIVLDNRMPGLSGLDVARRISKELPNTSIVFLTLDSRIEELARAAGADAVVMKDAPAGELLRAVKSVAAKSRRRSPGRRERDRLYVDSVFVISAALEAKEAGGVIDKSGLAEAARRLALQLGQTEQAAERTEVALLLRDIGKLGIPESILTKREPLEPGELMQLRSHAKLGAETLESSDALRDIAPLVRQHHERFDGSGYPAGLRGDDIALGAQVIGLLDSFNGIVSARPYKSAFPAEFAFQQIGLGAGREFSPRVVQAFFDLYRSRPSALLPAAPPETPPTR